MSGQSPFRDTIFALSSGGLPSGVAVVRLSGPHVCAALEAIAGRVPPARVATLCRLRDSDGGKIDRGLVLFFAGPASFTGEDCGELHVHGGRAVVATLLRRLGGLPGLRQSEAGEFTRRAFLNGKIDLTGVEGLADLLAAETEAQRRLAVENAEGGQRTLYAGWRSRLVHARAMIEAELDFADEADVDGPVSEHIWKDLGELSGEIAQHCAGFSAAEIVREGFRVALMGAPNAGKSSLLNALARREVAIVTDVPGTTRDPIEIALDLRGGKPAAFEFLRNLKLAHNAVSLGGMETLVCHPMTTTHSGNTPEELAIAGITGGLVRISVGVEDWRDLLRDFEQALDAIRALAGAEAV